MHLWWINLHFIWFAEVSRTCTHFRTDIFLFVSIAVKRLGASFLGAPSTDAVHFVSHVFVWTVSNSFASLPCIERRYLVKNWAAFHLLVFLWKRDSTSSVIFFYFSVSQK